MENTFDLKKFLVENRLTTNSKNLTEVGIGQGVNIEDSWDDTIPDTAPTDPNKLRRKLAGQKEPGPNDNWGYESDFRQLKPVKYEPTPIPAEYSYRIVYMYSDKPEYQIFTANKPAMGQLSAFTKIAPKRMEDGDGIMVLDKGNKAVDQLIRSRGDWSSPGQARPGELSQMTV